MFMTTEGLTQMEAFQSCKSLNQVNKIFDLSVHNTNNQVHNNQVQSGTHP